MRLPKNQARRAAAFIRSLADEPKPDTAQRLTHRSHIWRWWLGQNERVVFAVCPKQQHVVVVYVGSRNSIDYFKLKDAEYCEQRTVDVPRISGSQYKYKGFST